jgi:hypothetical protein
MSGWPQTPLDPAAGGATDARGATAAEEALEARETPAPSRWTATRVVLGLVAAVVLVWLIIKASEDLRQFAVVSLNGITLADLCLAIAGLPFHDPPADAALFGALREHVDPERVERGR